MSMQTQRRTSMIPKWFNTNADTAAGMVGITSDDIRSFSRGEVICLYDPEEGFRLVRKFGYEDYKYRMS